MTGKDDKVKQDVKTLEKDLELALEDLNRCRELAQKESQSIIEKMEVKPVQMSKELPLPMIAVDGSHSFMLKLSGVWIALIKTAGLLYRITESDKGVGFELKRTFNREKPVLISPYKGFADEQDETYRKILEEASRTAQVKHTYIANELRRMEELKLTHEVAQQLKNTIIAMDGTLTTSFHQESKDIMQGTLEACDANDNILVGVSKDSHTHAFGARVSDEELLAESVDQSGMHYVKAPEEFQKQYRPPLYGDIYFARLFPHTSKWFRIDIGTAREKPEEVLSHLAHYAHAELCPGYPYPLVEAHRYVITVRQLHNLYQSRILDAVKEYGVSMQEILSGITNIDGDSKTFHKYLDRVSRK